MRLKHPAGQQLFVDFAGYKLPYYDARTRKQKEAHLFVATMGYSKYTYVEATPDQKSASWLGAHVRALTFFGAVPQAIVCDNLKAAVSRARQYDADLNPAYSELSAYYNTPVAPARSRKPQDKGRGGEPDKNSVTVVWSPPCMGAHSRDWTISTGTSPNWLAR